MCVLNGSTTETERNVVLEFDRNVKQSTSCNRQNRPSHFAPKHSVAVSFMPIELSAPLVKEKIHVVCIILSGPVCQLVAIFYIFFFLLFVCSFHVKTNRNEKIIWLRPYRRVFVCCSRFSTKCGIKSFENNYLENRKKLEFVRRICMNCTRKKSIDSFRPVKWHCNFNLLFLLSFVYFSTPERRQAHWKSKKFRLSYIHCEKVNVWRKRKAEESLRRKSLSVLSPVSESEVS